MRSRSQRARWAAAAVCVIAACGVTGCAAPARVDVSPSASETVDFDALSQELIDMAARDQNGRTGGEDDETDTTRTARLKEIIADVGWPTIDAVGAEAADAAWLIAQHSDLDPQFQADALELITAAANNGDASPGNVAYLKDRVDVAAGVPQTYGTQIRCAAGVAEPSTPLAHPADIEALRAQAGLEAYARYQAEMTAICATETQ